MIEKAFLPVRFGNCNLEQSLANHVAQRLDPTWQRNPSYWKGREEMHVVGHYDITANGDIMPLRSGKKDAKCLVDFASCQQILAFVSVECDKVKGQSIVKQDDRVAEVAVAIVFCCGAAWLTFY